MTKPRIGLVGFHSDTGEVFQVLGLDIVAHIFANPENKKVIFPAFTNRLNFHEWKHYDFHSAPAPTSASNIKQQTKTACFGDFIRCTDRWDWSREFVNDWSDYEHLFSLAFDHAWYWIQTNQIETIVYSNVPHQGTAVVQFHLAQILGIKTRIFIQSQFAGRSWLVNHWNDLGNFTSCDPGKSFDVDVSQPEEAPFYMGSVRSEMDRRFRVFVHKLRSRSMVSLGLTGITPEGRRRSFQRNMNRWQRAVQDEYYMKNASTYFNETPGDEPYVYFPLHLQPEMTTDILGGIYADQLSALETLREITPESTSIYVKENPKQMGRLRGKAFFKRLTGISNVKLLSRNIPSFELIEKSIAVATISGTAGWEALRLGKPAIAFGDAFWNRLPGAFRITEEIDWSDIKKFSFNRDKLAKASNKIGRHAHPGICDPAYSVLTGDFNPSKNSAILAQTLIECGRL